MMLQTKCEVRQSWATCFFLVHLGCLRPGMLEPWLWWNGLGLHLEGLNLPWLWWNGLGLHLEGLNLDYDLIVFARNGLGLHLEGIHLLSFWPLMLIMCIHLRWAQVLGLESLKNQIGLPFQVEFNLTLLGLSSFTTYMVQTIMMGLSVGLESSWFKQRPNKCIMKCNLHGPT